MLFGYEYPSLRNDKVLIRLSGGRHASEIQGLRYKRAPNFHSAGMPTASALIPALPGVTSVPAIYFRLQLMQLMTLTSPYIRTMSLCAVGHRLAMTIPSSARRPFL
jgi:hypothetical protein